MKIILGVDPGFASFGYGAIGLDDDARSDAMRVVAFGVFETAKTATKAKILATEDNLRRARELASSLDALIARLDEPSSGNVVIGIAAEAMSWPRNASTTGKIGIAWGVLATVSHLRRVPILQGSPQAVKKALVGRADASKEDVQAAVLRRVPAARLGEAPHADTAALFARIGKSKLEHPADALACALFALSSDVVLAARRAA